MPAERIGMRDAREIIRLKFSSVSTREIGRRLGVARSTIQDNLKRAAAAGLGMAAGRTTSPTRLWSAAFWPRRGHARPAAAGRAGLGGLGARAEAS